ncbi:DUF930 domain-containing protein [Ollibium composti]|uniref:DUF930 domain-containing protein n=1 Tax=Ollibium composti TaxID=2675109 RepID=A0ABY2QBL0_9HYPH|nr:DUF930 domain-containing protein [Mesorhizobium composti]THF59684.1 DUF930 domain-containing protein [Mesorhizobium composti]
MQDDRPEQRWLSGFALPVSAGLHLVILALLIFGLPHSLLKPEKDQSVSVDLVPPPEQPPKPKTEPPAPRPDAEKPPEKKAEPPPPPAKETPASPSPVPSFNPVVQYGEKDSGPKKSLEGNSAEQEAKPSDTQQLPDEQTEAEKEDTEADDSESELALPDAAATPTARPTETARPKETAKKPGAPKLRQAKKLFSPSATGNALATTAIGGLPRSARGATLCVSELREQLLRNVPPYFADLLPSSRLESGNVINVPGVAFRANGQWRDLSYRCEVDADATKVVSFAFRIGEPIPPGEWQRRGLPSR